jgi:membrane protein
LPGEAPYGNSHPVRPFSLMMNSQATNDAGQEQNAAKTVAPGLWPSLKGAAADWSAHKSAKAGAAIAYYSIFSIGPLIVVVISLAALFFGREGVQQEVTQAIRGLLGDKGSEAVNAMLTAAGAPSEGVFASIIGTVTLVLAAIGVVVQLKEALNVVWEVKPKPGGGIWGFTRSYVLSLAGVLTVGFLLLVSMLLTAALSAFARTFGTLLPESLLQAAGFLVSFAAISALFIMMFKWLPDAAVEWRDVWLGGVGTAALFEIGKFLIGLYIGKQGLESTYGASASIVVVLIWVYYSAQIVLFGAEFTHVRARQRASAAAKSPVEAGEDDDWRGTARGLRPARRPAAGR